MAGGRKSRAGRGGGKSKKKKGSGGGSRHRGSGAAASASAEQPHNFLPSAGPGCHIARDPSRSAWVIGLEPYDPEDYDPDAEIPDIGLDPNERCVSVTNTGEVERVCYVTVFDVPCLGRDGKRLGMGQTADDDGNERGATTFIALCPPLTFVHLCTLDLPEAMTMAEVQIESDISDANPHPDPEDEHPLGLAFPLACRGGPSAPSTEDGNNNGDSDTTWQDDVSEPSYLCTQGEGGHLTHFLRGNYHAIDFRCKEGTPILAAGDGTVVEVQDSRRLTGVAVGNLYGWNSVMIELDAPPPSQSVAKDRPMEGNGFDASSASESAEGGPLFVEYVHIQYKSSVVKRGERVTRGQIICRSGSVGFSPEPHLHFSAFRSKDPLAPTVRVRFLRPPDESGEADKGGFIPRAGMKYNGLGALDE